MNQTDIAKAIAHTQSIVWSGVNALRTLPGYQRGKLYGIARRLRTSPDTLQTALLPATSDEQLRSGILRIKAETVGPALFSQPFWDVRFIPCGTRVMTGRDYLDLYNKALQVRGLVTQLREFYRPLSDRFEGVPLAVVDMMARGVGYPCGLRVIKVGQSIYDRSCEHLSARHTPPPLMDELAALPTMLRGVLPTGDVDPEEETPYDINAGEVDDE